MGFIVKDRKGVTRVGTVEVERHVTKKFSARALAGPPCFVPLVQRQPPVPLSHSLRMQFLSSSMGLGVLVHSLCLSFRTEHVCYITCTAWRPRGLSLHLFETRLVDQHVGPGTKVCKNAVHQKGFSSRSSEYLLHHCVDNQQLHSQEELDSGHAVLLLM